MEPNPLEQYEQNQLDDFELKGAQESLDLAGKQNQNLAEESRILNHNYYDKILLYSAGAFSFSTALIGLVVGNKTEALAKNGFLLPNIFWLYLSLFGYLVTCILILISKRFDSAYVRHFGMHIYTEKYKREREAWLNKLRNYPGEILVTNGGNRKDEIKVCENNIKKIEQAIKTNLRNRNISYHIMRLCNVIAEFFAIISTVLLLLFTIQLTQAIIWN